MSLVGSYVALSKPLTGAFPVFILATLRFAIAALAMLPWLARGAGEAELSRGDRIKLFWQSFFGNFLFSICMLYGVALSSATSAGIVMSLIPAAVALLSRFFLREGLSRRAIAALVLAVLAILAVNMTHALSAPTAADRAPAQADRWLMALGTALLLAAVFCEAVYVVIGKQLSGRVSAKRVSAQLNLIGLALMAPLGVISYLAIAPRFDFAAVGLAQWLLLLFYALAASQWSVWLWITGIKDVPAAHAGVFTVALPIASTLVGVALLGEAVTIGHGIALACAVAGIGLIAGAPQR